MTPKLPGYQISEKIYEGERTNVYRGTRQSDGLKVVIKFLRNSYPSFSELVQFRNQYAITKNLNSTGIVQPLSLERYGNGYALVMPEEGAISLDKAIEKNESFDLGSCLKIAIQLADILIELDRHRVIHKDIKPSNILILPETRQVKLIDFSIASLLPREAQEIKNFNVLEGTLAYISPEQTGRMNRGIDYRSDFYSLGATLYELLTGSLPFSSSDPMELVHCHISQQPRNPVSCFLRNRVSGTGTEARNPVSLRNRVSGVSEIPPVVSDIVMKLMAKNAEERYQSALGLKFDLENCLNQWLETGKIEAFELATRDIAGRFNIPEKLYGREAEVQTLLASFDRVAQGSRETLLVAGFSGIGKTAVVNEVHKPIVKNRGYFIQGKFDKLNRNIPFSAFVPAFRSLMGQLLGESDADLEKWKTKILEALGDSGQVLIEVIPELENVIGKQPPVPELSGSAAQNRFNLLFQKFIAVFTTAEHPLAIFLDDLQWADLASLQLFELLMQNNRYLLMLGAYRDNEVSPTHPLMQTIASLRKDNAVVNTITLNPLKFEDTNRLIAETLNCTHELAEPLTELVHRNTQGNPFFATQFLKSLHGEGYIEFDHNQRYWQCDLAQVRQLALTDDVVQFMMVQLQKLSAPTQNVLKLAACIGNQFDLQTLAIVSERSLAVAAADLWKALQEGFILPTSQVYKFFQGNEETTTEVNPTYRFLHDRVQQAAYSFIPDGQKEIAHYRIGKLLLSKMSSKRREERIFEVVNQLNLGSEYIVGEKHKYDCAKLNLQAGQKALSSTAYTAAREYFEQGLNLLGEQRWVKSYNLTRELQEGLAESTYLNCDYETADRYIEETLQKTQELPDRYQTYKILILLRVSQGRMQEGIEIGIDLLEQLRIDLVSEVSRELPLDVLTQMPELRDPDQLFALQLLVLLLSPAFNSQPDLCPKLASTIVEMSNRYGLSQFSAAGYSLWSVFSGKMQFADTAIALLDRFDDREIAVRSLLIIGAHVWPSHKHINSTFSLLSKTIELGLEVGDVEYAAYGMMHSCGYRFLAGETLSEIGQFHHDCTQTLRQLKQFFQTTYNTIFEQLILNLQGVSSRPEVLTGQVFDKDTQFPLFLESNNRHAILVTCLAEIMLFYLFENHEKAACIATFAQPYQDGAAGLFHLVAYKFYSCLAWLANWENYPAKSLQELSEQIDRHQEDLKNFSDTAPMNCLHKYKLVEAERNRLAGNMVNAMEHYDRAIAGAKENGYIQEEALANELFAKFYLDLGREKEAAIYMTDAYYCYAQWGAKAKTDDLERRYGDLLAPIFNPNNAGNSQSTVTSSITDIRLRTSLHHNTTFDRGSAIAAARAISGEIQLQKLLSTLMRVSLENAGAQKGAFILAGEEGLTVAVQAFRPHPEAELEIMVSDGFAPLDSNPNLPRQLIHYAARTGKTLVLDRAATDRQFAADPYLSDLQPQSILCAPIRVAGTSLPEIIEEDRDRFVGFLYLENTLAAGAFTRDRLELLELLSAQAAISIENARLYHRLEEYSHTLEAQVESRTEHLQSTLQQLQKAQLQLIQTEKMSSLGQMVAGIAHEINNPIGFISGNIPYSREHFHTVLELLELYQREFPNPSAALEEKLEESELDFVKSDMENILESMETGSDRIRKIILRLRNFSRLDEAEYKQVDIHEGLDNTLLILQHRLKSHKPKIAIVKNYAELPCIQCYANQLNQVFLNILSNAIDALRMSETLQHPKIAIATEMKNPQTVRISIGDNGSGMSENICQKVFDPFFTTKPVGQGTGLGLSTSYQIITEQHQGQLHCISQPGEGAEFIIEIPIV